MARKPQIPLKDVMAAVYKKDRGFYKRLNDEQKKRIFNRNSRKTSVLVEDIAHTVKFLLSDESNGITGQVLNVDNGTI